MAVATRVLLLLLACAVVAHALPAFVNDLPSLPNVNGDVVKGVGHLKTAGRGPRNQFGKDFNAAGRKWTVSLCKMDSDGDGFTNGQELGDPDCKWQKGNPSIRGGPATHPGDASSKPTK